MLENPEGKRWILHEHEKIINHSKHRAKTEQIDGFIYEGGPFRWFWWKLFGNDEQQYYTSGYQNRIAEIAQHIEEEDAEKKREKLEQEQKKKDKNNNGDDKEKKAKKDKHKKILVTFNQSIDAYRSTDESFRLKTMSEIDQSQGSAFYGQWTFFKVENSNYIQWLAEEAPEIFIPKDYMHFSFISVEGFVDIVTTYEPIVRHLDTEKK
jgi:hypothetical protein